MSTRTRLIVGDAVFVLCGYAIGLALRLDDLETWAVSALSALPAIVTVHLLVNSLTGVYSGPNLGGVSIVRRVSAVFVAIAVLIGGTLVAEVRPLPLSGFLYGGAVIVALLVLTRFGVRIPRNELPSV